MENLGVFAARLKNENGVLLEEGKASVDIYAKCVTFENDFVPLYPIDTKMEVVRIYEGKEVHRFVGKVYLSDKTLMRITSVNDELLEGSEICYQDRIFLKATAVSRGKVEPKRKWSFKRRGVSLLNQQTDYNIDIVSLTVRHLIFQFEHILSNETQIPVEKGDKFSVSFKTLKLIDDLNIKVIKPVVVKQKPGFLCDIIDMEKEQKKILANYLHKFNLRNNKVF